jgi:hypothetical protein
MRTVFAFNFGTIGWYSYRPRFLLRIETCAYSFLSRLMQTCNEFVPSYMY